MEEERQCWKLAESEEDELMALMVFKTAELALEVLGMWMYV